MEEGNDASCLSPTGKSPAEKLEGIAFTFCKAATIVLITQKFALPVCAGLAALFYVLAYGMGKKDTCCWLKWPPLIAGFWGTVCVISTYFLLSPQPVRVPFWPH